MVALTGTEHGDAANDLFAFYQDKAKELDAAGQYFMASVALGLALECAILAYLLVEFGEDNGGELRIPHSVGMADLIRAADEFEVLAAAGPAAPGSPRTGAKSRAERDSPKEAAEALRSMRNLIHPARALREGFDPRKFTREQYREREAMYSSVVDSLLRNL